MEQDSFKTFSFLLKLVLLLQLTNSIHKIQLGANATQPEIYLRMSEIESNNRLQANEISLLKVKSIEDRNEIHLLRDRVFHLESTSFINSTNCKNLLYKQKRAARLFPERISKDKSNKETEEKSYSEKSKATEYTVSNMLKEFYGPPTSCRDLNAIGFTLNGFYLVKRARNKSTKAEIQAIYCRFKLPQGTQLLEENRFGETSIGVVDVKSTSVHFYVSREGDFSNDDARNKMIKFKDQVLNDGNGFDWDNQWFLAPYPGKYFFSISGSKDSNRNNDRVSIFFRVNGKHIGEALSSRETGYGSFSYQLSLTLNENDKVDLELSTGIVYFIHFTGWMVEQDHFTSFLQKNP